MNPLRNSGRDQFIRGSTANGEMGADRESGGRGIRDDCDSDEEHAVSVRPRPRTDAVCCPSNRILTNNPKSGYSRLPLDA